MPQTFSNIHDAITASLSGQDVQPFCLQEPFSLERLGEVEPKTELPFVKKESK